MKSCIIFVIPNSKSEGAQNFFRKLFSTIDYQDKHLIIEEKKGLLKNILLINKLRKSSNLTLITTVNSNKLGLIFKCLFPNTQLIARLGNTISQEIELATLKYYIHKFFYFCLIFLSDSFIFQSDYMKKDFIEFFKFKKFKNFNVIHNGTNIIYDLSRPKKSLMSQNIVNFLLVGSFKPQKGYEIFIEALAILDDSIKEKSHFHICGDGAGLQGFQKRVQELNLENHISCYGDVTPNSFYQEADVYILPSRFEGFSNSLIEALSFGLPSIVSDGPGANKEVIIENLNGILFKNLDAKDLKKKINFMHQNYTSFSAQQIQHDANTRFSINKISSQYKEMIKSKKI